MRKIIFLMHVSLDGFVATTEGDMSWLIYNKEIEAYSHDLHASTDVAIYGRVTYEMMAGYWPTVLEDPNAGEADLNHARWANDATKYVVSETLESVDWVNTVIIKDNIKEAFTKLKNQPGKDMWLLGSPRLAQSLMELDLIDEYRLNINPVILGSGMPLFKDGAQRKNLELVKTTNFDGGVIGAIYVPVRN
ncbi:MAG: dihydrofolate reductase family protein [Aggregatilineales bacterium]